MRSTGAPILDLQPPEGTSPSAQRFRRKCILARRLVERGVRFIQIYSGGNHNDANWDVHGDLVKNHRFHAGVREMFNREVLTSEARPERKDTQNRRQVILLAFTLNGSSL